MLQDAPSTQMILKIVLLLSRGTSPCSLNSFTPSHCKRKFLQPFLTGNLHLYTWLLIQGLLCSPVSQPPSLTHQLWGTVWWETHIHLLLWSPSMTCTSEHCHLSREMEVTLKSIAGLLQGLTDHPCYNPTAVGWLLVAFGWLLTWTCFY